MNVTDIFEPIYGTHFSFMSKINLTSNKILPDIWKNLQMAIEKIYNHNELFLFRIIDSKFQCCLT